MPFEVAYPTAYIPNTSQVNLPVRYSLKVNHLPCQLHEGDKELHIKATPWRKQGGILEDIDWISNRCPCVCVLNKLIVHDLQSEHVDKTADPLGCCYQVFLNWQAQ